MMFDDEERRDLQERRGHKINNQPCRRGRYMSGALMNYENQLPYSQGLGVIAENFFLSSGDRRFLNSNLESTFCSNAEQIDPSSNSTVSQIVGQFWLLHLDSSGETTTAKVLPPCNKYPSNRCLEFSPIVLALCNSFDVQRNALIIHKDYYCTISRTVASIAFIIRTYYFCSISITAQGPYTRDSDMRADSNATKSFILFRGRYSNYYLVAE
jgi:hypothetical protein